MAVHTASFYQPQHWVGHPFRVSRQHPRGRKTQWNTLPFFYPPRDLLKAYRSDSLDFDKLCQAYMALLEGAYSQDPELQRWMKEAPGLGDFTLLCFEREDRTCHRRPLARWLQEKAPTLQLGFLR